MKPIPTLATASNYSNTSRGRLDNQYQYMDSDQFNTFRDMIKNRVENL